MTNNARSAGILGLCLLGVAALAASLWSANGTRRFRAELDGYQETPSALSTPASGEFEARLESDGTLTYELSYSGFGTAVTASHIHLGRPGVSGSVIAFLCGGGGKPTCPQGSGTVEGSISPADVIGPGGQGIAAGEFEEFLAALRAGATYVNVHSATYLGGEIRGAIGAFGVRGRGPHD